VRALLVACPWLLLALAALPAGAGAEPASPIPRGLFGPSGVNGVKAVVATATALLLGAGILLRRRGRPHAWRRTRDAALAVLGVLGALCWWNLLQFNYPHHAHPSDTFHYYLGAKYFPELGFTRLYECVALADVASGVPASQVAERHIRNLETNHLETPAAVLARPARCRSHFSPERWESFVRETAALRAAAGPRRWVRFQQDHGYNATPLWTAVGRFLTAGPLSANQLFALRLLDPMLLLAMWAAVVWGFGWRTAAVGAVYWGTSYVTPFGWTGGSILRQDWLAATVLGIVLLRRDRPLGAGLALTTAALLRVFPVLAVAGVGLGMAGRWARRRRVDATRREARFAAGCAVALVLGVGLSAATTGGLSTWADFAANSRTHLSTPLLNHVGLRTVLSHDPEATSEVARDPSLPDPMAPWKDARRERYAGRALLHGALVVGFLVLVARGAAFRPAWVAAVLGIAAIPVALELTGYYWSVLVCLAFLQRRHPTVGAGLAALAALSWGVSEIWHWTDPIHVWVSVLTVAFSVYVVLLVTHRAPLEPDPDEAASVPDPKNGLE